MVFGSTGWSVGVISAGKVRASELTEVQDRGSVVCSCCFDRCLMLTDINVAVIHANSGYPSIPVRTPPNSFIPRSIIDRFFPIAGVLFDCRRAKVFIAIVKCIAIPMICGGKLMLNQNIVHINSFFLSIRILRAYRVEITTPFIEFRTLVPLINPLVAMSAHKRVLSLRKGNDAIRWIKRLYYSVFTHVELHKEPSFLLRQSAALNSFNYTSLEAA